MACAIGLYRRGITGTQAFSYYVTASYIKNLRTLLRDTSATMDEAATGAAVSHLVRSFHGIPRTRRYTDRHLWRAPTMWLQRLSERQQAELEFAISEFRMSKKDGAAKEKLIGALKGLGAREREAREVMHLEMRDTMVPDMGRPH